jgi:WD40 repeat protein
VSAVDPIVVPILLFVTFGYLGLCAFWPYRACFRCHGSGWLRAPIGRGQRICPHCGGVGARTRLGRHIYHLLGRYLFGAVLLLLAGTGTVLAVIPPRHTPPPAPVLLGHDDKVFAAAFSPDGAVLASGSADLDRKLRLWDVANPAAPRLLRRTDHPGSVRSVAFSPTNPTVLASGSADGWIRLWDVANPAHPHLRGHLLARPEDTVFSLAFSPDGTVLASGSADGTVRLWDVTNPADPHPLGLSRHAGSVRSVAFSPDGRTLASGSVDTTVRLWNVAHRSNPRPLGQLTVHTDTVVSVTFSPNGRTLASGGADRKVGLWNVTNPAAARLLSLTDHPDAVWSVAFSPNGRTLASGSIDGTVRLWDMAHPAALPQPGQPLTGHTGGVNAVMFSPDGRTLASASDDTTIRLWPIHQPAPPPHQTSGDIRTVMAQHRTSTPAAG